MRRLLGTTPLGLVDLLVIGGGVLLPLVVNELTKPKPPPLLEDEAAEPEGADAEWADEDDNPEEEQAA